MANKDVRLVISAKDEATKTFDAVVDALKEVASGNDDAGKSASSAGTLFSQLARDVSGLARELSSLNKVGDLASDLDKAGKAVDRLAKETQDAATNFAKAARETEKAARATEKLRGQSEGLRQAVEREKAALSANVSERAKANRELGKAETAYKRVQTAIDKGNKGRAAQSALVFAGGDVERGRAEVERLTQAVEKNRAARDQATQSLKAHGAAVKTSEQNESRLRAKTEELAAATTRNRNNLTQARGALAELGSTADRTGQAMGNLSVKQATVAQRTKETAEDWKRANAEMQAMSRFSDGRGGFVDPQTAQAIQRQRAEVDRARASYESLAAMAQRLANQTRMIGPPTADAVQNMRQAASAARAAKNEYEAQLRVLNQMPGAMKRLNGMRGIFGGIYGESRKAMSGMQRLRGEVLSLATAYVGLYGTISNVGGVITAYQSLEAAQNRLGAVFNQNESVVAKELGFIERQAARLGIQFGVLADQYGKFSVAANAANFTSEETRKVFLSVAEAGRVNKLSLDQMQGIFLALEQMISKGKIQSEELRRQLGDRLPGAFNIMAEALGVTTAALDDMMKKGEVIADSTTLQKFADELDKRFGSQLPSALRSTTTLIGQFTNELFQAQLRVAEGGFIDSLNVALAELNEWFKSREGRDFFLSIGAALGNFVSVLAEVPKYFGVIGMAIKTFIAYKVTSTVVGMGRAFLDHLIPALQKSRREFGLALAGARAYGMGLTTLTGTLRSFGVALRALPGVAIFTAAMYAIQTLIFGWGTAIDETTQAVDEHRRVMGEVISTYEDVGRKAEDWANKVKNVTADQAAMNLRRMVDQYEDAITRLGSETTVRFDALDYRAEPGIQELQRMMMEVRRGQKTVRDFIDETEKLYKTFENPKARQFAEELLESARGVEKFEIRMREAAVIAEKYGVSLEEAQKIVELFGDTIEGIVDPIKESGDAMAAAAAATSKYQEAINALKEEIPELAAQMKQLEGLGEIEANYQRALSGALTQGQVNEAYNLREQARTNLLLKDLPGNIAKSFQLIAGKEGMANEAYPDWSYRNGQKYNSGWRIGYGSDTVTLADGSIKKVVEGMKISQEDAVRDLNRRIGEFQGTVKREIGLDRWGQFNEQQQAVLTSLAYNYGNLSKTGILATIKSGDINQISDAIEGLGTHNSGINAGRRRDEARLFRADSQDQQIKMEEARAEKQREITEELAKQSKAVQDIIGSKEFELRQNEMIAAGKGREAAIEAAITEARRQKADLTADEIAAISEITGRLYDQQNATNGIKTAEEEVNRLYQLRQELMQMIEYHQSQGETSQAAALKEQLEGVNTQLREAIANAIAMHEALGGPGADLAIAKLKNMELSVKGVGDKAVISGQMIAERFTGVLVGALKKMAQAIAEGENAWEAFANAFLQGMAEMLIEIGEMIIRQMILNALQGFLGGFGGLGGMARPFHNGGVVGSGGGGAMRSVGAGWFNNAVRMHDGGIAGIKPGEMPAILKQGEEVLTEDDPRHRANGGGGGTPSIKIVNSFDAADVISEGLSSNTGEQVLLNVLKANAGKVRQIVGG